jgi:hypothetical protein
LGPTGTLFVCDAYLGLQQVNVSTGEVRVLATSAGGQAFVFLDSIVVMEDGTIYMTESSTRHTHRQMPVEALEASALGRLLKYDPVSKETIVLLDKLYFSSGLSLSHDKEELLISLWSKMQVVAYSLKNSEVRVVADNLPGPPDSITPRPNGESFWVALTFYRNPSFSLVDLLAPYPRVRHLAALLFGPMIITEICMPQHAFVVEMDGSGRLLSSLQEHGSDLRLVTEALEHNGTLFIGTHTNAFIYTVSASRAVPVAA